MFEAMQVKAPIDLPEGIVTAIQKLTTDPYGVIQLEGIFDASSFAKLKWLWPLQKNPGDKDQSGIANFRMQLEIDKQA